MTKSLVKKVVLAYSGGLDTSVIVPWLRETYNCEVICFCADIGQAEELSGLPEKALASGASKCIVKDLREEFAGEFLFPMLQSGAVYERQYLLGTSVARPLIAKWQVAIAEQEGEDALQYAKLHKVPVTATVKSIYSRDRNLWHLSHEGGILEDPAREPEEPMFQWTASPESAPDKAEVVEIAFERGVPVSLNGV